MASLISFTHYKGPTAEVLLVILYTLKYSQFRKSLALSQEHTKADSLYPLDPIFSLFTVSSFLCSDGTVYGVKQQPDACREQSVSGCYFLSQNISRMMQDAAPCFCTLDSFRLTYTCTDGVAGLPSGRLRMLQSLCCTPDQFFTGGFSVSLRNFHDQLVNGNRFLLCNLMEQLQERGVAAGKAEDQILRQYGGAVAISSYYSPSYSLLTASPLLSREPTCNRRRIEYTYQQHDLQEMTA